MENTPIQEPSLWGLIIGAIIALIIYFLPTGIAEGKKNSVGIFILNLFLGWTFIGWVAALIWAVTTPKVNKD